MPVQAPVRTPSVSLDMVTPAQVKVSLQQKPVLQEEVLPVREFVYKEEADSEGNRKVTLKKDNRTFNVKSEHARKQLCALIHYPLSVFQENEPALNMTIMKERLSSVRAAKHMVKYHQADGETVLEGILPHTYATIRDVDLVDLIAQTLPDAQLSMLAREGPTTTVRILSRQDTFNIEGHDLKFGMTMTSSEVGASKLVLDTMLFVPLCSNGAIVTWGSSRYFTHNYREIQAQDLRDLYTNLMTRFLGERETIRTKLTEAVRKKMNHAQVVELWEQIKAARAVSKAFVEEIAGEFQLQAEATPKSIWDVAQHVTQKAHEQLPPAQRIRHEIYAGQLLGLDLDPSVLGDRNQAA